MILKIIWSKVDKCEEVMEISNYYAEDNYLEATIGKNMTSSDREIIVSEGLCNVNVLPGKDGENCWEEVIVYSDNMVEIWKTKNLDIKLVKELEAKVVE